MDFTGGFMQNTEKSLKSKKEPSVQNPDDHTRSLGYGMESEVGKKIDSSSLSKNLSLSLMNLIEKVNEGGVTPETVNASCNAASQIYKILRLNYEMKKEGY